MEKAYRRLDYLMEGRAELRELLDEKRDDYLAQKQEPPHGGALSPGSRETRRSEAS